MKFRYNGDRDGVTVRGVSFPPGKTVDVTSKELAGKLKDNSHFDDVKTRKRKAVGNGDNGGNQRQGSVQTGD